jgi:hypothetical protein
MDIVENQLGKSIKISYFSASFWGYFVFTIISGCICRSIRADDLPVISHGRMQCLTPFDAYEFSELVIILPSIIHTQPLGKGIVKAPLQNPYS